jgi:3'(2'), 5'-bisphosphate nucleotidase
VQNFLNQQQINQIFQLALQAGKIASKAFLTNNFEVFAKKDGSKVSSIDIQISELISQNLAKISPNIPIICEEGFKHKIHNDQSFFLVDPIDGTSSFINNSHEFCINIALIKNNKPVFGLIYAPLYQGGLAVFSNHLNEIIFYNHQLQEFEKFEPKNSQSDHLKIVTSLRTKEQDIKTFIEQFYPNYLENFSLIKLSSAIKFFKIIDGSANIYLHFRDSMEWDIASGHALINLMQLQLINLNFENNVFTFGDELQYNKENFINKKFVIKNFN